MHDLPRDASGFRLPPSPPRETSSIVAPKNNRRRAGKGLRVLALASATMVITLLAPDHAALADLKLCNTTASRVGVAIGYKDNEGWATEGWWNVASHTCETLLKGNLIARFYYVHAIDYDRGGEWAGASFMCTDDKAFTIRGSEDCTSRKFKRTGFFEVDTTEERDWTVRLTDPDQQQGETKTQ